MNPIPDFQAYVCGFLFSADRTRVLLLRKNRPAWQAGKLNGVGGKIEPGETPLQAMHREFREEAGLTGLDWQEQLIIAGDNWRGHFFRAFGDVDAARAVTDESVHVCAVHPLTQETIPNLRWIIPMMLDEHLVDGTYRAAITEPDRLP